MEISHLSGFVPFARASRRATKHVVWNAARLLNQPNELRENWKLHLILGGAALQRCDKPLFPSTDSAAEVKMPLTREFFQQPS